MFNIERGLVGLFCRPPWLYACTVGATVTSMGRYANCFSVVLNKQDMGVRSAALPHFTPSAVREGAQPPLMRGVEMPAMTGGVRESSYCRKVSLWFCSKAPISSPTPRHSPAGMSRVVVYCENSDESASCLRYGRGQGRYIWIFGTLRVFRLRTSPSTWPIGSLLLLGWPLAVHHIN